MLPKSNEDNQIYLQIREVLLNSRQKAYTAVNFAMVEAYWSVGKMIVEAQSGNERAEYGDYLIKYLSGNLTNEFGKGFTVTNLKYMRQFYLLFPISHALRDQLSWTHYRLLMKVEKEKTRDFYINECIANNWSTRQLERQINSFYYERILSTQKNLRDEVKNEISTLEENKYLFASKYKLYMPTEEELKRELVRERKYFELEESLGGDPNEK